MKEENPDFKKIEKWIEVTFQERFDAFQRLLTEYNQRFNLTAITEEKEIKYKHFADSLAGEGYFKRNAAVCEIGSGAGFPSIPLAIVREDLSFTLIESVGKKCAFLERAASELGLKNIRIFKGRAEEYARTELRETFDVCCARAVAKLNTLAEYCLPFVKEGGIFLAYKTDETEERKEAEKAVFLLGGGKMESIKYSLPENYGERALIFAKKVKKTPGAYPRGNGKERKQPIV